MEARTEPAISLLRAGAQQRSGTEMSHRKKRTWGSFQKRGKKEGKWAMERLKSGIRRWREAELRWSPWNAAVMGEPKLFKNEMSAVIVRCLNKENRKSQGKCFGQSLGKISWCKRLWERNKEEQGSVPRKEEVDGMEPALRQNMQVQRYSELCREFIFFGRGELRLWERTGHKVSAVQHVLDYQKWQTSGTIEGFDIQPTYCPFCVPYVNKNMKQTP